MSSETGEVDTVLNETDAKDPDENTEDATQPNIGDVSPKPGQSALKQESEESEKERAENGSCILPAPKVGIRVKRELLAFDNNINERLVLPHLTPPLAQSGKYYQPAWILTDINCTFYRYACGNTVFS